MFISHPENNTLVHFLKMNTHNILGPGCCYDEKDTTSISEPENNINAQFL